MVVQRSVVAFDQIINYYNVHSLIWMFLGPAILSIQIVKRSDLESRLIQWAPLKLVFKLVRFGLIAFGLVSVCCVMPESGYNLVVCHIEGVIS